MKASTVLRIGDTIRKLRENKGWTQKKLAEESGVHEVQIRRYENNQAIPRDTQLSKIASALGCQVAEIDKSLYINRRMPYFATALQELRLEHGLTQQELAKELKVTEKNISDWENAQREPYPVIAEKIANYFGTSLLYFLYGGEEYKKYNNISKAEDIAEENAARNAPYVTTRKNKDKMIDYPLPYKPVKFTDTSTTIESLRKPQKRHTLVIDTKIDETNPINIILKKRANGEELTPEESKLLNEHIKKSIKSLAEAAGKLKISLEETFSKYYAQLNEAGQKEADKQIEKAIERATQQAKEQAEAQIILLTKIPEYQKKPEELPPI